MRGGVPPMAKVKKQLRELLDQYFGATPSGKVILMARLRDYTRRQKFLILMDEIRDIDLEQELDVLLGVGMKGVLYFQVIKQKAKCVGL